MSENIYSTQKILHHLDKIKGLREKRQLNPVQMHLMPENRCNHSCLFCSYRIAENKNASMFDCKSHIPLDVLRKLIRDFKTMGGQAFEITGGGEPLLYPNIKFLFEEMNRFDLDYSLVSNGVLLTEELAKIAAPKMTWARISIDAATPMTYGAIRRTTPDNFQKALQAVELLRKYSRNEEFRLGVGFVVTNDNYKEIYSACKMARDAGADNIRISAVFHPDGYNYFKKETITQGSILSGMAARDLTDEEFKVYDLFDERVGNCKLGRQDYRFCGTKELLCVVGGDCNVYTCCSLAFNKKGLIGNIEKQDFAELWSSAKKEKMFEEFDASQICGYMCLYESRNRFINSLLTKPQHVNFI